MFKYKFTFFVLTLLFTINAFPSDGSINIDVNLSPVGTFKITTEKVKVKGFKKDGDQIQVKKISIKKNDLKTGIDLRDEHMKKRIKERTISVKDIKASGGSGTGTITINKVKKEISFKYKEDGEKIKATFSLNLLDFKIDDINYLGVGVENSITLNIEIKNQ
jgi:hypothetical protein